MALLPGSARAVGRGVKRVDSDVHLLGSRSRRGVSGRAAGCGERASERGGIALAKAPGMTSTMSDYDLRLASLVGRAVTAVFAMVGLLLVLAMFGFHLPYKPDVAVIALTTLLGLAGAVWLLGDLVGRAVAQRGRAAVAWGPVAGIASLGISALAFSLTSAALYVGDDLQFRSLGGALWDRFGKPLVFIMAAGALPAALIGLLCAASIHCIVSRQKRASVEDAS
ncbi:hypothetical protein [Polyangium aurulentum]|uniref:hypothetical protein n=1 Tax=Polyangium aurulentum TaxID=2567896 RepID=UPI0010ADBE29|nr:hypothetical protein [Polyangium aurulentum]UQA59837.1 hypothetical protein E8A73_004880 [Polyangium aurulentum]